MPFIDQKELLEKTDGGRLIIEHYYPKSAKAFTNSSYKFKCRTEEKTASSSVKRTEDGTWIVCDFGGDAQPRNGIQVCMYEENIDFKQALDLLAAMFNIIPAEQRAQVIRPEVRKRKAEENELPEATRTDFTIKDIKLLLAPRVWDYLISQVAKRIPAEEQEKAILDEVVKIFTRYNFYALESYTIVKNGETITISRTEHFPIYVFDLGSWKKIYKPREIDASFRFMYMGDKPKEFTFGLEYAEKCWTEVKSIGSDEEEIGEDEDEAPKKKKPSKLKNITIVSGGSDGLNLAVVGQAFKVTGKETVEHLMDAIYPVWLNSETAILSKGAYKNLALMSEKVYNLPDIDNTGKRMAHKLASEYLDIRTIYLPEQLKLKQDGFRHKAMKDLRDYWKHYSVYEFGELLRRAYPYRFWDSMPPTPKKPNWTYSVNNKHLMNFLSRNGFYRYNTESSRDGYIYIQIVGNVVHQIDAKKIRDFVNQFVEERMPDVELMNTFLRSNQLNESSLSNLPYIEIDFSDHDKENQWFFYENATINVSSQGITAYKPGIVEKFTWDEEVVNRKVKPLPDFFTIDECSVIKTRKKTRYINIHNQDCLVFRYLIQTSRMFWRAELEQRIHGIHKEKQRTEHAIIHQLTTDEELKLMDGLPKPEREAYLVNHKFDIAGPLLTPDEQLEQMQHLINKLFALGYIFHRHKENGKAWAIWGMDAKLSEGSESHGGSGKSLLPNLIASQKLMKTQYREGRNPKLVDNPHIYEGVDKHTDMMLVDDCARYLKFDFFFSSVSGPLTVNPKNNKQYTVEFTESPKFWFTSNYPPFDADISTERRLLYMLYSDYYHYSRMGEYNEDRSVLDEFGKNFGSEFTPDEWNLFLNLIMQCVKFFLQTDVKIGPPMDNVNKRNLKATMGDAFEPWADVYFSPESDRLDKNIVKQDALNDYVKATNQKQLTTNRFTKSLKAWCLYNGYEFNPKHLQNSSGRIIERIDIPEYGGEKKSEVKEMIYIATKETNIETAPF